MNNKFFIIGVFFVLFTCFSCEKESAKIEVSADDFYGLVECVTKTMVHDIFSPPVASRVYVYPNIAAYEIIAQSDSQYESLSHKISDFKPIPKAQDSTLNLRVSAIVAHIEVSKQLIFSKDLINNYQDSIYTVWENTNKLQFEVSKSYGIDVANHIVKWMHTDNYKETRTLPAYTIQTDDPSRWQPTPPNYMNGIEPHWREINPLVLDSASQFIPNTHPEFSLDINSLFYKELQEVYNTTQEIVKKGNDSEEVKIAQFWDCNPYVAVSTGHLMTATKKISPGAHWIGITKIACLKSNYDLDEAIYAHTMVAISLFDGFISCWDEKYRSNLIRPETLINEYLDKDWVPLLQTPPFPEYTSGHSVVSGSASRILTHVFGDNFSFEDTTELDYGLPTRAFKSFNQAAEEAAISRLYGGIHYRAAIDNGLVQGRNVGDFIIKNLSLKK